MSKKSIFILFLLYFCLHKIDVFAQITAKRVFLTGSFGVSTNEIKSNNTQIDYNYYSVSPSIGYVWKDNWAFVLGGSLGTAATKEDRSYYKVTYNSNSWGVNFQVRRYLPINEKLGFYIPLILSFGNSTTDNYSERPILGTASEVSLSKTTRRDINLALRPTFYYFIHRKWSLETGFATLSTGYNYVSAVSNSYNVFNGTPTPTVLNRDDSESNFSFAPTLSLTNFFIGINYFFN